MDWTADKGIVLGKLTVQIPRRKIENLYWPQSVHFNLAFTNVEHFHCQDLHPQIYHELNANPRSTINKSSVAQDVYLPFLMPPPTVLI